MSKESKYESYGVSAQKEDVHNALKYLMPSKLYPRAFCNITVDPTDKNYCYIMHSDGAGTKSLAAYNYWKETGDMTVWKTICHDAIIMNLDDLLCVGATKNIYLSSIVNRNKELISGDIIKALIVGTHEVLEELKKLDINIHLCGGETADVGDIVSTVLVDATVFCRMKLEQVITNDNIQSGDVIVGLASFGRSIYETEYNSGIGSNGLTLARHELKDVDAGKLLLSPTKTYAPVMKKIFAKYRKQIHGMIHCTGGGQTKVLHFLQSGHVIKDNLFTVPEVFQLIQKQSNISWKEMYQVFNMGHRMELYVPKDIAIDIIEISQSFHVDARIVGRVEDSENPRLTIKSHLGSFEFICTNQI